MKKNSTIQKGLSICLFEYVFLREPRTTDFPLETNLPKCLAPINHIKLHPNRT